MRPHRVEVGKRSVWVVLGVVFLALGMTVCGGGGELDQVEKRIDDLEDRLDRIENIRDRAPTTTLTATPSPTPRPARHKPSSQYFEQEIQRAVYYLKSRYDPELQLVAEAAGPGGWHAPSLTNLVPNPDVEERYAGPVGWAGGGPGATTSSDAYSAGRALRVAGSGDSWTSERFPVKGETRYVFGAMFKVAAGKGCGLTIRFHMDAGASGPIEKPTLTIHGPLYEYLEMKKEVTAPAGASVADLVFESVGQESGGCVADDFFVSEIRFWTMDNVYWLGDNRLAWMALKPYHPDLAEAIRRRVESYFPYDHDDKPDVLEGLQIDHIAWISERVTLEEDPSLVIFGGRDTEDVLAPQSDYADVMLTYALQEWRLGDRDSARERLRQVIGMWDGVGLLDGPASYHGSCAVYKLALFLIALQVTQEPFGDFHEVENAMWHNQDESGGIVTGIGPHGRPTGGPNTETTALVLLVYDHHRIDMLRGEE